MQRLYPVARRDRADGKPLAQHQPGRIRASSRTPTRFRLPNSDRRLASKAASLLGVAPFDRDSGQFRGGRAQPRHLPSMAALSAIRWEPSSEACCQRLLANGKKPKVALVAVMRRLAGLLGQGYSFVRV